MSGRRRRTGDVEPERADCPRGVSPWSPRRAGPPDRHGSRRDQRRQRVDIARGVGCALPGRLRHRRRPSRRIEGLVWAQRSELGKPPGHVDRILGPLRGRAADAASPDPFLSSPSRTGRYAPAGGSFIASSASCARSCTCRRRSSSDAGRSAVWPGSGSSAFVSARAARSSCAGSSDAGAGAGGARASRCRRRSPRTSAASPRAPPIHASLLRTRRCYPVAASCLVSRLPFPEPPAGEAA
jgi:hypothetical protein